jgi:NADH-quinone oxidoreductase subunit H
VLFFVGGEEEEAAKARGGVEDDQPAFDAFAGGYPVPPMPGQLSTSATVPSSAASVPNREQ